MSKRQKKIKSDANSKKSNNKKLKELLKKYEKITQKKLRVFFFLQMKEPSFSVRKFGSVDSLFQNIWRFLKD